jgi:hypothetical protein
MASGVVGVAVVLCAVVAGCGTTAQREAGPSGVAEEFLAALEEGDTATACAALAPEALEALVAAVWSDRAQVRTDADVLFLTEFATGWKVAAAGCRSQGDRPYQCEVSG